MGGGRLRGQLTSCRGTIHWGTEKDTVPCAAAASVPMPATHLSAHSAALCLSRLQPVPLLPTTAAHCSTCKQAHQSCLQKLVMRTLLQ